MQNDVQIQILESEQAGGSFRVEVPDLDFNQIFTAEPGGGVIVDRDDLPDGLDSFDRIWITDLGATTCRPTPNATCRRSGNSSGGSSIAVVF